MMQRARQLIVKIRECRFDTTVACADQTIDADDDNDVVNVLTGMTDDQLRDQLRQYAGSATAPIERV